MVVHPHGPVGQSGLRGRRGEGCALLDDWASAIHSESRLLLLQGEAGTPRPEGRSPRALSRRRDPQARRSTRGSKTQGAKPRVSTGAIFG